MLRYNQIERLCQECANFLNMQYFSTFTLPIWATSAYDADLKNLQEQTFKTFLKSSWHAIKTEILKNAIKVTKTHCN